MNIFLAGSGHTYAWMDDDFYDFYRLESFFTISNKECNVVSKYKSFMLDSGAFSFMQDKSKKMDWDKYVEDYAAFINKHNVDLFFELDIDSVVGIKEVERLRKKLESLVNKKSIPVWHKSRGKEYWLDMVKNYKYVAFGGILTDGIPISKIKKKLSWFCKEARKKKCKVHVLGFTPSDLHNYPFIDSCDSTAWLCGNRFGYVYKFENNKMVKYNSPINSRVISRKVARHNFKEWVKYQKHMEVEK